jgi:hypothetical protein
MVEEEAMILECTKELEENGEDKLQEVLDLISKEDGSHLV